MKIRDVKTYIMASPGREYLFVKIETDEALYGWGEGTLEMKCETVAAAVRDLQQFILGEDPTRIDFLWQRMYRQGFWRGGVAILSAISAIEQALWDVTGKAYGQPVHKLLGGAVRDVIPCYTHCGDPDRARAFMEQGWRAFKSGPSRHAEGVVFEDREILRRTAASFGRLREACGDDVKLMCDAHGTFRPALAIRVGRVLEEYGVTFFEEAVPPDNVQSLRLVREAGLGVDLATGERAFLKWGFRELIEQQLVDVIQPDVCHDGGIKETLKIAAMAETYNILVAPHNPNGPVATAASTHVAALLPNFLILEYANSPTRDDCQAGGDADLFKARDGRIELPTKPGLGIDLDEDYLRAHPVTSQMKYPRLRHLDGAVADV